MQIVAVVCKSFGLEWSMRLTGEEGREHADYSMLPRSKDAQNDTTVTKVVTTCWSCTAGCFQDGCSSF